MKKKNKSLIKAFGYILIIIVFSLIWLIYLVFQPLNKEEKKLYIKKGSDFNVVYED